MCLITTKKHRAELEAIASKLSEIEMLIFNARKKLYSSGDDLDELVQAEKMAYAEWAKIVK